MECAAFELSLAQTASLPEFRFVFRINLAAVDVPAKWLIETPEACGLYAKPGL